MIWRRAPVVSLIFSSEKRPHMMGDIQSGLWLDRLGKIAAIMIVGAFILTLLSAEFWMLQP